MANKKNNKNLLIFGAIGIVLLLVFMQQGGGEFKKICEDTGGIYGEEENSQGKNQKVCICEIDTGVNKYFEQKVTSESGIKLVGCPEGYE